MSLLSEVQHILDTDETNTETLLLALDDALAKPDGRALWKSFSKGPNGLRDWYNAAHDAHDDKKPIPALDDGPRVLKEAEVVVAAAKASEPANGQDPAQGAELAMVESLLVPATEDEDAEFLAEIEEEPKVKVKKARKPRTAAKKATAPTPTLHLKEAPSAAPKPVVNPLDALAAKRYELVDAAAKTHNQAKIAAEALDNFDVELASITDRFLEGAVPDTTDIPEAGEEFFKKAKLVTPKKAVIAKKSNGGDAVATVVAVIRSHDGPLAVSALVNTVSNTPLFNPNGSRSQAAIERQVQECLKTLRKSKKVIMSRPKGGESHWALT